MGVQQERHQDLQDEGQTRGEELLGFLQFGEHLRVWTLWDLYQHIKFNKVKQQPIDIKRVRNGSRKRLKSAIPAVYSWHKSVCELIPEPPPPAATVTGFLWKHLDKSNSPVFIGLLLLELNLKNCFFNQLRQDAFLFFWFELVEYGLVSFLLI